MIFDEKIWGPQYWFVLMTIAMSYPEFPNDVTKRKYYDLIQNFPLFLPSMEMSKKFSEILDKHPVSPYLGNRDSFIRWVYFIHNKINVYLGKDEISFASAMEKYLANYFPRQISLSEKFHIQKKYIVFGFLILFFVFILYYSD